MIWSAEAQPLAEEQGDERRKEPRAGVSDYASGHSLLSITRRLNFDGVLRPHGKNRKRAWVASTTTSVGERLRLRKFEREAVRAGDGDVPEIADGRR